MRRVRVPRIAVWTLFLSLITNPTAFGYQPNQPPSFEPPPTGGGGTPTNCTECRVACINAYNDCMADASGMYEQQVCRSERDACLAFCLSDYPDCTGDA